MTSQSMKAGFFKLLSMTAVGVAVGFILMILAFFANIVWEASINQKERLKQLEAGFEAIASVLEAQLHTIDERLKDVETDHEGEPDFDLPNLRPEGYVNKGESKDSPKGYEPTTAYPGNTGHPGDIKNKINTKQEQVYQTYK